jgi:hypothetical protein
MCDALDDMYFLYLGRYLYIETSWVTAGAKTTFTSPAFNGSPTGSCILFWYHMYGSDIGNY